MIYFFADNHYNAHPGKRIYEALPAELKARICFFEDDWSVLENEAWENSCELLILNMIGDTCGVPYPVGGEARVERYIKNGGSVLLLHGSSAAFWKNAWWRRLVGLRWVRPNDPDGITPSTHPIVPCTVTIKKGVKHPLAEHLKAFSLPTDEVYINLEQSYDCEVLMETTIAEGTFPQCAVVKTGFGGEVYHFLPGHTEIIAEGIISNISAIIKFVL